MTKGFTTIRANAYNSAADEPVRDLHTPVADKQNIRRHAFTVCIGLRNTGVCPWIPGVGQELRFSGVAEEVRLPKTWPYEGEWLAPGTRNS